MEDCKGQSSLPHPMTTQQYHLHERRSAVEDMKFAPGPDDQPPSPSPSPLSQQEKKKLSKQRIIILAATILIVIIIIIVPACYFAARRRSHDSNGKEDESISNPDPDDGNDDGTNNSDASNTILGPNGEIFPSPNRRLKRVFYGMAYVPMNAQLPDCGATAESVADELQLLAKTTRRVRLYGTDCGVLDYTLQAIKSHKLDLKVVVGIWIDRTNETFTRQEASMFASLEKYGWDNIIGISVGNEVLYDHYQPLSVLIECVKNVKSKVMALGHSTIPVFTSDLVDSVKPPLTNNEDISAVNLHPFFSGINIEGAADWFWRYYNSHVKDNAGNVAKPVWVTEVGWPSFPANAPIKGSTPSVQNLQLFIDTWLCEANQKKLPYYFFEFFDAPWKIFPGSPVEGFWGIMTIDKKLKVKLPNCLAD
ncbi:hypothetical protein DFQ27_003484 [Actinomortierella ambigua]|uniref:glucan endo-1,3-beta-D-glucosidase n=1 Tax=Actinomortierella ambigua TaxID=1343610 RepID=A0A9P6Q7F8_9FUNG|nr:hypothetical protein DFQ27_003484 [Actinomortierella ambigua]